MPKISVDLLRMWSEPGAWSYLGQFEPCSIIAVPLHDRHDVVGSLVVWRETPAIRFEDNDLVFAERVGERLALVVR